MDKQKKLNFLKYVLLGRVQKEELVNIWKNTGEFPTESQIDEILATEIDYQRMEGLDWPTDALTMIGLKRMNNLHEMLDYVRIQKIEGDLIETGVWKGGATIFMKLYCDVYGMNKKIFVCDSFEGLPKPSGKFSQDNGDMHHTFNELSISLENVKRNFESMRCLDDNVIFIKGFFGDTLPNNKIIDKISLLRMDGDMYESTHDVFYSCYNKLVDEGVCIIDDYCLHGAKTCVHDFRDNENINDKINFIDKCGIYWIKNEK
jgi:O-methyltransferase